MNDQKPDYWQSDRFKEVEVALGDSRWQIRAAAARALPSLAQAVPLDWIRNLLFDPHKRVRIAILEVCSGPALRNRVPVEWIRVFMSDPQWAVRAAATWCIGYYGPLAPVAQLLQAADDPLEDVSVRAAAIDALGRVDARTHRARLLAAVGDPSWYVREAALIALERIAAEVPFEVFVNALHDESVFVRSTAAQIQGSLGPHASVLGLLAALEDDELVSRMAISAMNRLDKRVLIEAIGLMAFTPADSPLRTILQEEAALFEETALAAQDLLALLPQQQQMEAHIAPAHLSPASLDTVQVKDVLMLRNTPLWSSYVDALTQLLTAPRATAQQLMSVYYTYNTLLDCIATESSYRRRADVSARPLLPELTFAIGGARITIRWTPHGPLQYCIDAKAAIQPDGTRTAVHADLHLLFWLEEHNQLQHFASIDILRGYTTTPQQQWQQLTSFFQGDARFSMP